MVAPMFGLVAFAIAWRATPALGLALGPGEHVWVGAGAAVLGAVATVPALRRATRGAEHARHEEGMRRTEAVFLSLQVPSACFLAFAHGSNDVGNTVGPLSAIFSAVTGGAAAPVTVPFNVLLIGAAAMAVGVATYGFRVMGTVRDQMSAIPASRGFTAEVSAGVVILVASKVGMPVSATHTLVAAVVGVGLARSLGALDSLVLRRILTSWLVTVPLCGASAAALYFAGAALF
jgi:PiT family inorganic phosphate transporter